MNGLVGFLVSHALMTCFDFCCNILRTRATVSREMNSRSGMPTHRAATLSNRHVIESCALSPLSGLLAKLAVLRGIGAFEDLPLD